ncbi:Hypothetical predicted protein [Olea europaea subsp. europaea]|uniref:Uncharacterized protein n=1 Tax=Olea europaea subsp. europaea TaxID=158383 RepID=A0A8S0TC54_OLEEU|nr:Hypothetical predicted protein [Olea europaea subsp. europaea]
MNGNEMESTTKLLENVIIANSMYEISNTLLLVYEESYHLASDTQVFEGLSVIVVDIIAACLTNLPHAILKKCNNGAIEKREKGEWCTLLKNTNHGILAPTSSSENIITASSGEMHLYVQELRPSATSVTDEGNAESHVTVEVEELGD